MTEERTINDLIDGFAARGETAALLALSPAPAAASITSFATLAADIGAAAAGLQREGIAPGDRVAVYGPPSAEWITACLAIVAAGAVAAPVDDNATGDALCGMIANSGARMVLAAPDNLAELRAALRAEVPVFALSRDDKAGAPSWRRLFATDQAPQPARRRPDDVAMLFFTSGTTGTPKGVPLTHQNLAANVAALQALGVIGAGQSVLNPLPLYHAYPFVVGLLTPLGAGASVVLPAGLSGPEIARALAEAKVAVMIGVPRLYDALATAVAARLRRAPRVIGWLAERLIHLSAAAAARKVPLGRILFGRVRRAIGPRLRLMVSGGAPLDPATERLLVGLGWDVLTGYGLVETTSVATYNPPGEARIGSAGRPSPAISVRIEAPDETGAGDVLLKGTTVFDGYWNAPEENRQAFTADGWFRTGDLGRIDHAGYLWITGRRKETIVLSGGKKIAPDDVEKNYAQTSYVQEIAILEHGGALVALVVPDRNAIAATGATRARDTLRVAFGGIARNLPAHQRITGFAVTDEPLPRTRLGKIRRHELPALYRRAQEGRRGPAPPRALSAEERALVDDRQVAPVWQWLERRFAPQPITPDLSPFTDLGLDSLAWVELAAEVESAFGVTMKPEALDGVDTLGEYARAVAEARPAGDAAHADAADSAGAAPWLDRPGPMQRVAARLFRALVWALARLIFRLRVEGLENLPAQGPFVLAPNHASDLDPLVIAAGLPVPVLRRVRWAGASRRLFDSRFKRWIAGAARMFPVDERRADEAIAAARRVLEEGDALVWFAEAWRTPDGELQRFLPGIGRIVADRAVPVVPAYIGGTFDALPRDRYLPKPVRLSLTIAEPIMPEALAQRGKGQTRDERIADALHDAVAALAQRGEGPMRLS